MLKVIENLNEDSGRWKVCTECHVELIPICHHYTNEELERLGISACNKCLGKE